MSKHSKSSSQFSLEQNLLGITQNAVFPEHLNEFNYRPRTLIDETLETIDPTPDVHGMFMQFNQLFFWGKLDTIYVRWSPRMTTCAGTCTFHPRSHECVIALSAPLLKLRPRKDLVETLLHEMIHGYLFVTNNNRDRDGHGPEFCKHMNRINKAAGTNITIYHSFHDEVRLYQQHWWKCDGPCKNRPPFYGTVRRAMNRAPGPTDIWWAKHQATCGGKFIKIREPEKPKTRSKPVTSSKSGSANSPTNLKSNKSGKPLGNQGTLDRFVTSNNGDYSSSPRFPVISSGSPIFSGTISNTPTGLKKLGNSTNNVYGFGTGGSGSYTSSTVKKSPPKRSSGSLNFTVTVGGKDIGRSRLLDLYPPSARPTEKKETSNMSNDSRNSNCENESPKCPICDETIFGDINDHVDRCLTVGTAPKRPRIDNPNSNLQECPICRAKFSPEQMNVHIELCLPDRIDELSTENTRVESTDPQSEETHPRCPICNKTFNKDVINFHVEVCLFEQASGGSVQHQPHDVPNNSKKNKSTTSRAQLTKTIDLTDSPRSRTSNITNCFTCNKDIRNVDYYDHVQECLAKLRNRESRPNEVIEIQDDVVSNNNRRTDSTSVTHYKCLVCNEMVNNNTPLEEHLEVCVQIPFSNSIDALDEIDESSGFQSETTQSQNSTDEKQLCPICMELIPKKSISTHVDQCNNFKI